MTLGIEVQIVSKQYSRTKRRLWYQNLSVEENPDSNITIKYKEKGPLKILKKWTQALDQVSLKVEKGEILGLLGPNGAGKTTLAKIISTLVLPDSGVVKVNGFDVEEETVKARFSLGLVTGGERSLYWKLTPEQNLRFFGSLYGMTPSETRSRADDLIKIFGLIPKKDELVQDLSTGYKMKTAFARSLMHDPEVLVLDEYNRGLDPKASRQLREYIKHELQKNQGKTVLIMTHSMEVAEDLCDRVILIDQGQIVARGTPASLKSTLAQKQIIEIETKNTLNGTLRNQLSQIGQLEVGSESTNAIKLIVEKNPKTTYRVLELFQVRNVEISHFNLKFPTLEDVFIQYTGKKLEDEES